MNYSKEDHKQHKLVERYVLEQFEMKRHEPLVSGELNEMDQARGKSTKLIVLMEAIHTGRTANYTFYTKEGLLGGLESWTTPYPKPVLTHHNQYEGEPIGRIVKAEYKDITASGKGGLLFTTEITDPNAIEKVLDGRYQTVSIGATTDKVVCNICGTNRVEEWCDHFPGESYDSQECHFIIGNTFGKEVSYVNVPADQYAGNVMVQTQEQESPIESAPTQEINPLEFAGLLTESFRAPAHEEERSNAMSLQDQLEPNESSVVETEEKDAIDQTAEELNLAKLKIESLIQQLEQTQANYATCKQQLAEKEHDFLALFEQNRLLMEAAHHHLAEQVVQLKRQLQKPDVMSKSIEEAVSMHAIRTKESLEFTISDLKEELKAVRPEAGSVQNPGKTVIEETNQPTAKDAVNILTSMFSNKRKS